MGLPIGPTLASPFLCYYEKLWLGICLPDFKPIIYRRYVDYIFVSFKSKDNLLSFVRYIITRHKHLKLTLILTFNF